MRITKTDKLAEELKKEIAEQRLPANSSFLSTRNLSVKYNVSIMTAERILNRLVDEDILYRKPYSGTFIKHGAHKTPLIGYAGYLPQPDKLNPILHAPSQKLCDFFDSNKIDMQIILYDDLISPTKAASLLEKIDGLLISYDYVDMYTLKSLRNFGKPAVVIGNQFMEEQLFCNQVIPDFVTPLLKFFEHTDIQKYEKISIVSADHPNGQGVAKTIQKVLKWQNVPAEKIEQTTLNFDENGTWRLTASRFFAETRDKWRKQLVFLTSGYFAQGLRDVFGDDADAPDVLSIDNLEEYLDIAPEDAYFTAIDRSMSDIYMNAVELLLKVIAEKDKRTHIIHIPGKLVIRKSAGCLKMSQK